MFIVKLDDDKKIIAFTIGTKASYDRCRVSDETLRFIDRSDLWFLTDDVGLFVRHYREFYYNDADVLSCDMVF